MVSSMSVTIVKGQMNVQKMMSIYLACTSLQSPSNAAALMIHGSPTSRSTKGASTYARRSRRLMSSAG